MNAHNNLSLADDLTGVLVINADDWGQDKDTTDRIFKCVEQRSVSSVSAMVFMEDSERAAAIARERNIDAGLHLNFTTPFAGSSRSSGLIDQQRRLTQYLRRHRFAQVVFHPGLTRSFEYVVAAQLDEFRRLYGDVPDRVDGHHHMHLCANVVFQNLLPPGIRVRRNFSFEAGEKGFANRLYRRFIDRNLSRRHILMDCLFTLPPLEPPSYLNRVFSLARRFAVEVETHPANQEEYQFLMNGEVFRRIGDLRISPGFPSFKVETSLRPEC